MNCNHFPSAAQSLLNSPNKPPISSHPSNLFFKSNNTHVKIPQISTRTPNITARASTATANRITTVENETLYDLLGISENGTLSEIKHAYKKMALKYHPDVSPPDRAEEYTVKFIRVQEAYETLSDPEARSVYDSYMAKGLPFNFSGKRETRFDQRSEDKKRWKETWTGQISELTRRSRTGPNRVNRTGGMSWAARIRKQRSESCGYGSDSDQ
ncbi:putative DnaJ domain, Chaperone J-domain superfamily [Helianthus annuus]|uniref:DnaJ domain, Chaperone J-domain superfamily n=1 Tax=Helianthus annuus TaxID=4232 RepID=A0A9K3J9M8_HELAN|nr:chaperone protein dnaJ 20, chloroplastic-like [Helianthus annuus]KAF5810355.1 putative DnaJ domain, Chaperone J-domain superfamily [Helianthus annuus]KAJ0589042.1 putative DnaJ domain, Chaperone J-domain superfamily [Helianthus annuus]KAJ0931465.1 putative DnaJ domain, Chaperone J-domain superfamily [Helianthus annuus]